MGKTEYTMKHRALSNICTGICTLGVYLLIQNVLVTILMLGVFSFVFATLFTKNKYIPEYKIFLTVLVIILIALMFFIRFKPDNTPKEDNTPTIADVQEEPKIEEDTPIDDQEVITDETTKEDTTSKSKKSSKGWSYETLPDKKTPTYSYTKDIESNIPNEYGGTGNSRPVGSTYIKVTGESKTNNSQTQAADEAEKKGDSMDRLNEGIISGIKDPAKEETKPPVVKDETTKQDPNKNKVDEMDSAESNGETEPPAPSKDEQIPLEDQVKEDLTEDELKDLATNTPKEEPKEEDKKDEVESQPEHNQPTKDEETPKEEIKQPEEDKKEEKEEVKEEVKEEIKEEVAQPTPVTITPLDGSQAYAGDSVQFKITGDVGSINGLDGFKYSMANGYLTVETNPSEATVLTISVIGTDGVSTATASVTINVINVQ